MAQPDEEQAATAMPIGGRMAIGLILTILFWPMQNHAWRPLITIVVGLSPTRCGPCHEIRWNLGIYGLGSIDDPDRAINARYQYDNLRMKYLQDFNEFALQFAR